MWALQGDLDGSGIRGGGPALVNKSCITAESRGQGTLALSMKSGDCLFFGVTVLFLTLFEVV